MQKPPSALKQSATYTFKYESNSESIDINTLLLSQMHFSAVLNGIKNEVSPNANLAIKIKPLAKGSIPFEFVLDLSWMHSLFNLADAVLDHADTIVSTLAGLITLREFLKGKKPQQNQIEINGESITITIGETKIVIAKEIYDLYMKNKSIDESIKKVFEAVDKDEDITGLKILDSQKKPVIDVPREQFGNMTMPSEQFDEIIEIEPSIVKVLTVFKIVFDTGYKWQFIMDGRRITATMMDGEFMKRMKDGEAFRYGDTLEVELQVQKVLDKDLNVYIEKEFKILKVRTHTPKSTTSPAFTQQTKSLFGDDKE